MTDNVDMNDRPHDIATRIFKEIPFNRLIHTGDHHHFELNLKLTVELILELKLTYGMHYDARNSFFYRKLSC